MRTRHALFALLLLAGSLAGAAAGATIGIVVDGTGNMACGQTLPCSVRDGLIFGSTAGLVGGGLIGYLTHGDHWITTSALDGARVTLQAMPRGGLQLGLVW